MYPVTQGEYEKVAGVNPSAFTERPMDASAFHPSPGQKQQAERQEHAQAVAGKDTSRHPVEWVSWYDAVEFCRRLSALPAERTAGRAYRLPTEAEWEFACRAGTASRWYCGDDEAKVGAAAWYNQNSGTTRPVGGKQPNAWRLYDMHGNIWQWCADWYRADYYRQSPSDDPTGPSTGSERVVRGGAWYRPVFTSRSAKREPVNPAARSPEYGFRVVCGTGEE
jgi:formylglycine-generating enzyme required for sulfatase activity